MLSPLTDGTYRELLVTYNLTEQEKQIISDGGYVDLKGKSTTTEVNGFNAEGALARTSCNWEIIGYEIIPCSKNEHGAWNMEDWHKCVAPSKPGYAAIREYRCFLDNTEDGTDTGGGSTGGGVGGGGEGGTDPNDPCNGNGVLTEPQQPGLTDPDGCSGIPSVPTSPTRNDPCEKIKTLIESPEYKKRMDSLKTKTDEKREFGFVQYKTGSFAEIPEGTSTDNSHSVALYPSISMIGYIHTHIDDYEITESDGTKNIKKTIKIFSPADIIGFLKIAKFNADDNRPLDNVYGTMVSSEGNYMLRFTGTKYQIKTNFLDKDTYREMFKDYFEMNKDRSKEVNFLNFLADKMQVYGVSLYKIEEGKIIKKELSPDKNNIIPTDCP